MYQKYFGLSELPFSIAPDPRYLYLSDKHREALAHLIYGVGDQGGFVLLTGEVGTGKTTICRCLLQQMPDNVDVAFIINPRQSINQLLQSIFDEFNIPFQLGLSSKELIDRLNDYLLDAHSRGRNTILIIDEAQNLSLEVLEQLRLLTNLETNEKKLLQLLLLGQPELLELLNRPELRQLAQRITARYHLSPIGRADVERYIHHRLSVAGCRTNLFKPAAVRQVFRLSNGVPRVINLLCDRALLGVYASGKAQVTAAIVNKASREVLGRSNGQRWRRRVLFALPVVIAVVLGIVLIAKTSGPSPLVDVAASAAVAPVTWRSQAERYSFVQAGARLADLSDTSPAQCKDLVANSDTVSWWQCAAGPDSWTAVFDADKPVAVSFIDPESGVGGAFVLLSAQGDVVTLQVGDTQFTLDRNALSSLKLASTLVPPLFPAEISLPIQPGDRGRSVQQFHLLLSAYLHDDNYLDNRRVDSVIKTGKLSYLNTRFVPVPDSGAVYDQSLQTKVKQVQQRLQLPVDAIVTRALIVAMLAAMEEPDAG